MTRAWMTCLLASLVMTGGLPTTLFGGETRRLSESVEVEPLADGVWLLRTTHVVEKWGRVPANGLAVVSGSEALLVDPGWDDEQASALLAWARGALHAERVQALVTHAHDDRIGGIRALLGGGVPVVESSATAALASARGYPPPTRTFEHETTMRVGSLAVEVLFPGAGHSTDNVVAFVPARRVLFGGCLVREEAAKDLGNVADADIGAWGASVAVAKARFGGAAVVVPGHGAVGGPALLEHTLVLARSARRR